MSNNSTAAVDPLSLLPPYLDLPPHLSAHKYFFVCTLTVAAWDTLVLSPRTWKLFKSKEWPLMKIAFYFLRLLMPIEFIIVAVAFFDTKWTTEMCQKFFLFEPILTGILVSVCSAVHLIRVRAIYDKSQQITILLGTLLLVQVCMMAVACGFYHVVPVRDPSQGCIAGPKHNWVGIYWVGPTLFFTTTFGLALARSFQSRAQRPIGLWKLMLRDGLNLYGAVWIVNMVNMLFWFIVTPTGPEDTIKTIVTSMAAVLTITMTMRIILSVRGTLVSGGSFAGSSSAPSSHSHSRSANIPGVAAARSTGTTGPVFSINPVASQGRQAYNLEEINGKPEADWDHDGKSSVNGGVVEGKTEGLTGAPEQESGIGVKVTVERQFQ
ncbi:hypothetical protein M422DRAFT_70334 [Sphaerobolus stellatus SS14]|uniref:Uncharacterized protein n=1 Tax=Sphaerobolus stellatus (strain SS14) TaxID=990650 RepID=A0A0C9V8T3_SPHS4|nr:hypothetical protein M422DRAFT_70334 [Sphaerobolus stellatus SS14]